MWVSILIRHKDKTGKTVSIDGVIDIVDKEVLKYSFDSYIDNAYLVNGEYRAKKGYHIKTVVDNQCLKVVKPSASTKFNLPNDFYGKNFIGVCRKIRNYASLGKIAVRTNKHDVNLFEIIKLCGLSVEDFVKGYHIENIRDREALHLICDTLLTDYEGRLADYEAYIDSHMDLRLLVKLCNAAIQDLIGDEFKQFDSSKTPLEVVNKRAEVMFRFANDLVIEPWQLYFISMRTKRIFYTYDKCKDLDFRVDFEDCYANEGWNAHLDSETLIRDFAWDMRKKSGA